MPERRPAVLVIALVMATCGLCFGAAEFYVAPDGDDASPGTIVAPFATLSRARNAIREWRNAGGNGGVRVLVRGGNYVLREPLIFGPEDSGVGDAIVAYEAYPGERPIFSGGRTITDLELGDDGIGRVWLADAGTGGGGRFEQLFVGGRRATHARSPNRFFYHAAGAVKPAGAGAAPSHNQTAFLARPEDILQLADLSGEELREVTVVGYHSWEISRLRIASVDHATGRVDLTGPYCHGFYRYTEDERYHVEGFAAALDAPGEWFLDLDGTLAYFPLPGEDLGKVDIIAPMAESLVHFRGDVGVPVAGIRLRGLVFRHAAYRLPAEGESSPQAASNIGAVIMADQARNVVIEDCDIEHVGGYAVWLRDGCRNCIVRHCFMGDLGAGGIRIGSCDLRRAQQPDYATNHIEVDNNIIRDGGRLWLGAVGVLIAHSGDNRVTHNDISALGYSGISVGWQWGYGSVPSVRNSITHNHIHHLGGVLADMGGIYTLGEAPGSVLAYNLIHDIDGYGGSSMSGIYNDNSTTDMVIENNVVYGVRDGGYKFGSGRDIIVRNNIFMAGRNGQTYFCIYYPERDKHLGVTLERNIFYGNGRTLLAGSTPFQDFVAFRNNLYWPASGPALDFRGMTFAAWQSTGRDAGSIVADPMLMDPGRYDVRVHSDSPAIELGFKPFDISTAGVYGAAPWIERSREFAYATLETPPAPPPLTFFDDFEVLPVGSFPAGCRTHVEGKGDALAVTDRIAATGKQCLQIDDAPDLEHSFNPHFYYHPGHEAGMSTFSFDLLLEPGAQVLQEWREYPGSPYFYTGPSFRMVDGKLVAAGNVLRDLPTGQWIHFEVSFGHGEQSTGTWDLTVTVSGDNPRTFAGLPSGSPATRKTTWLGFVSEGTEKATYYLDNLRLENDTE